jgi:hypothetical protein
MGASEPVLKFAGVLPILKQALNEFGTWFAGRLFVETGRFDGSLPISRRARAT